jgi:transposase InsO family protein
LTIHSLQYGLNHGLTSSGRKQLVVVDQGLLKGVILCPTTKTVTIDRIGDLLHENLYKRFGLLDKMISDREPQFAAKAFRAMLSRLGVLSTAYHPQMDGTMEWVNQEIEAYLVIPIWKHGKRTWQHWSSLTTIEDMPTNQKPPVACTFVNNPSASVDKPLSTVPMILLQCYCN